MKRRELLALAGASVALSVAPGARAQAWPTRTLRMILTAPPGSSIDVLGRIVGDKLKDRLGQTVVPENRAQAGGTIGTDTIAKADKDGYTFGLSFTGPLTTAPYLYSKLAYDPERDLAPIVLVGTAPNILAVPSSLPVNSFKEFIDYARARPGQLNYASVGNGSASHLAMELLKAQGKLFVVHIPYNGAPPAVQATAAGDVQAIMSNPTSLLPLIAAKRLKPLAVTGRTRWAAMKDLPTVAESGFRELRGGCLERVRRTGRHATRDDRTAESRDQHHPLKSRGQASHRERGLGGRRRNTSNNSPTSWPPNAHAGSRSSRAAALGSTDRTVHGNHPPAPARPAEGRHRLFRRPRHQRRAALDAQRRARSLTPTPPTSASPTSPTTTTSRARRCSTAPRRRA